MSKLISLSFKVPSKKDLCWDWQDCSCEWFSNEGGHAQCSLRFNNKYNTKTGEYERAKECLELEVKK